MVDARKRSPVEDDCADGARGFVEPNSFDGPKQDSKYVERPKMVSGTVARHDHPSDSDYYSQPGNLLRLMPADAQQRLATSSAKL